VAPWRRSFTFARCPPFGEKNKPWNQQSSYVPRWESVAGRTDRLPGVPKQGEDQGGWRVAFSGDIWPGRQTTHVRHRSVRTSYHLGLGPSLTCSWLVGISRDCFREAQVLWSLRVCVSWTGRRRSNDPNHRGSVLRREFTRRNHSSYSRPVRWMPPC
jgi:hypothetical protein